MRQKFAAPIKQVRFTRIQVCRLLIFVRGEHVVPGLFFNPGQQVVQFGGVFLLQEFLNLPPGLRQAP